VRRVARPLVPALATALETQNARYVGSPARDRHLAALRTGAAVVVTGQQVGLFLGPLYTIYKAASTIRLASKLAEDWNAPVVPMFWLQTEDHDAAEIAVCHVARANHPPLTLRLPFEDDAVAVAHRVLPAEIDGALSTLREALAPLPHGEEFLERLARHYRAGAGWGEAFAGLLAELFAEEGLVLLDPRDPALASLAAPVHRRALSEAAPIAAALVERACALAAAGLEAPVHVREGAPLSFFHPDGPEGGRCRLAPAAHGFVEVGRERSHTFDALLRVLDCSPASFSTSALLRPILQDTWLPTAAYVGGPAEVAYYAQLPPLYAAFGMTAPLVVPRAHLRLIEAPMRKTLARRGLTPADACRPFDEVVTLAGSGASGAPAGAELAKRLTDELDRALAGISPLLREAGPRGEELIEKTRRSMARSADKLGQGYDRARHLLDRELVDDVRRVQEQLWPGGVPQERFFGVPSFAARHGARPFVERVLQAAAPFATGFTDVAL